MNRVKMTFYLSTLVLLMANFAAISIAKAEQQPPIELIERLKKQIETACKNHQKVECSTKKCLTEKNPIQCYQEIMAARSFEDRIQEHKSLCDLGNPYECGIYCGMIEQETDFCDALVKKTQALTPEDHLVACQSGVLSSCSEYCRQTTTNITSKTYSKDLLACELQVRKNSRPGFKH